MAEGVTVDAPLDKCSNYETRPNDQIEDRTAEENTPQDKGKGYANENERQDRTRAA